LSCLATLSFISYFMPSSPEFILSLHDSYIRKLTYPPHLYEITTHELSYVHIFIVHNLPNLVISILNFSFQGVRYRFRKREREREREWENHAASLCLLDRKREGGRKGMNSLAVLVFWLREKERGVLCLPRVCSIEDQ